MERLVSLKLNTKMSRAAAVAISASALLLTACGPDSATDSPNGDSNKPVASGDGPQIFVIGGKADDPFWSRVKRGADDAAEVVKAGGGSVTWLGPKNYDNLGPMPPSSSRPH
jgi:simple sugar transport system substrate-binding protein